jgi:hypothetical protein
VIENREACNYYSPCFHHLNLVMQFVDFLFLTTKNYMNIRHQHTPNYYRNRMTEYLTQGQRMFSLKYYCWQRSFTDLSLNQTPFHVTIKKKYFNE